jgi:hypothetical protein
MRWRRAAALRRLTRVYPGAQAGLQELLRGLGLPARALPGPLLRLRREVSAAGPGGGVRSRCFVNGAATPLRVLREVGAALVDVNGQHAAQTLRRAPVAPKPPCRRAALPNRTGALARACERGWGRYDPKLTLTLPPNDA